MADHAEKQVTLYYAPRGNLRKTTLGFEPLWKIVEPPWSRTPSISAAETVNTLKKLEDRYSRCYFKAVDDQGTELFNDFTQNR